MGDKKRGKGAFGVFGISKKFQEGFAKKVLGNSRLEQSFGETMGASILNGNYQYHEENTGFAKTWERDPKTNQWVPVEIVVSLDYGGGMRPDYTTMLWDTNPQDKGKFERSVRPLKNDYKKYHHAYLKNYPESVLLSEGTIKGFDKIGHAPRALLVNGVKEDIEYALQFYNKDVFYNSYVLPLDKRDKKFGKLEDLAKRGRNDQNRTADEIREAAIEYLVDNQLARQLSMQEFTLQLKLKAAQAKAKDKEDPAILQSQQAFILLENPVYAIKNNFEEKFKSAFSLKKAPINLSVSELVRAQGHGSDDYTKMMDILANEFEMAKFSKSAMYNLVEVFATRLEVAVKSLESLASTPELKNEINEMKVFHDYLVNAVKSHDYNSSEEQTILALACDESYRFINAICYRYSNEKKPAELKSFVDAQWAITPRSNSLNTPDFENQRGIKTVKSVLEYKYEIKKLSVNPHPALAARASVSSLSSSLDLGGVSSSSSSSPSASPRSSVSESSRSSGSSISLSSISPSAQVRTSFFKPKTPNVLNDTLATLVQHFGERISNYAKHDQSVKDCMKDLSHLHKSSGEPIAFSANFTSTINSEAIALPDNVMRSIPIPLAMFNNAYTHTYNKSMQAYSHAGIDGGRLSDTANAMKPGEVTFNFIKDDKNAVTHDSSSFLAVKTDNSYSIKAVSLSATLSRTKIIESVLRDLSLVVSSKDKNALRDLVKDLEKAQTLDNAVLLAAIKTNFTSGDIKDNAEDIQKSLLAAIKKECYQVLGSNDVPADAYMKNTKAHIEAFIAEAGSNKTIYISPSSDPLLAQAYILVCQANNLSFKDESGNTPAQTNAIIKTWNENQELRKHVSQHFTIAASASLKFDTNSFVTNMKSQVDTNPTVMKVFDSLKNDMKLSDVTEVIAKIAAASSPPPSPSPIPPAPAV
jgi:hypothetical protein